MLPIWICWASVTIMRNDMPPFPSQQKVVVVNKFYIVDEWHTNYLDPSGVFGRGDDLLRLVTYMEKDGM